jgi:hypothetical protein
MLDASRLDLVSVSSCYAGSLLTDIAVARGLRTRDSVPSEAADKLLPPYVKLCENFSMM